MITSAWLGYYILSSAQTPKVIRQIFELAVYYLQCKQNLLCLSVLRQQFTRWTLEQIENKKASKKKGLRLYPWCLPGKFRLRLKINDVQIRHRIWNSNNDKELRRHNIQVLQILFEFIKGTIFLLIYIGFLCSDRWTKLSDISNYNGGVRPILFF